MAPSKTIDNYIYNPGKQGGLNEGHDGTHSIMSDEELASLNIKELNRKLKELGLPKSEVEKLKQRRRTLKNRKYATDCREKKDVEVHNLEGTKETELHDWEAVSTHNDQLRKDIESLKRKYLRVVDFAKKNKIKLKQRNVPI